MRYPELLGAIARELWTAPTCRRLKSGDMSPHSETARPGNASPARTRVDRGLSRAILQNGFDSLQDRIIQQIDQVTCFHVFANLFRFRCACNHGADIWIF